MIEDLKKLEKLINSELTSKIQKSIIENKELLIEINEKDLIAICDVGAYGMSLSSNYNLRPKPIELLIKGSKIKVIRKRQKHKDII